MKQVVNFRLSNHAINTLLILEKELHTSKTAIVEKALQFYAKKKLPDKNSLLEYVGILGKEEASAMLALTRSNKYNKDIRGTCKIPTYMDIPIA
jgi:hypothetical protein